MVRAMDPVEMLARQNCASILQATKSSAAVLAAGGNYLPPLDLMSFKCKDCNRRFPTFQALGGHRASHMKLRLTNQEAIIAGGGGEGDGFAVVRRPGFKIHECKECRIRFPTGQALGGHMRKHSEFGAKRKRSEVGVENFLDIFEDLDESKKKIRVVLELDLNRPPPEDELRLQLALVA